MPTLVYLDPPFNSNRNYWNAPIGSQSGGGGIQRHFATLDDIKELDHEFELSWKSSEP